MKIYEKKKFIFGIMSLILELGLIVFGFVFAIARSVDFFSRIYYERHM